jgi:hypothetical protein
MTVAPTLKRGYRPGGTRQYTLPWWLWAGLTRSLIDGSRRPVAIDAEHVIAAWPEQPVVTGRQYIPANGAMVVVANHYQRRGLWIGFTGGVLAAEIRRARLDGASVRFAVIGDLRIGGRQVPGSGLLLRRIAAIWGMSALPTDPRDRSGRARALRRLYKRAEAPPRGDGEPILLFPEGTEGNSGGLREALPGSGALLELLARAGCPILPAAVWETRGRLTARFGPAFPLAIPNSVAGNDRDRWVRARAMREVAVLLPARLRGAYLGPFGDDLDCDGRMEPVEPVGST